MTAYGIGPTFQASCPAFPPPPRGYRGFQTDVDGALPANVQAHATTLANDMSKPLGYADTIYVQGSPWVVRVDAHPWTYDAGGNVVAACTHGADVFVPDEKVVPPQSKTTPLGVGGTIFVVAMGLGAIVSGVTIWEKLR